MRARAGWVRGASWRTRAEPTTSLQRPPQKNILIGQQPGGGRLPAARPPLGNYPGPRRRCAGGGSCGPASGSRVHRPVGPVSGAAARPSRRKRTTVHGDLYDERGCQGTVCPKVCTHGNWHAPSTTRPRQLSHTGPREPETCYLGRKRGPARTTKKEGGRGVRAKAHAVGEGTLHWDVGVRTRTPSPSLPRAETPSPSVEALRRGYGGGAV